MRLFTTLLLTAVAVLPALAQEISYSTSQPLTLPHDTFFGMAAGVARWRSRCVTASTRRGVGTGSTFGGRWLTASALASLAGEMSASGPATTPTARARIHSEVLCKM